MQTNCLLVKSQGLETLSLWDWSVIAVQESCAVAEMSALHNPTIRRWFEARKSICTI